MRHLREAVFGQVTAPAKTAVGAAGLLCAFVLLVASRTWEQLIVPRVWNDDGDLLASFLEYGWPSFFEGDYLVLFPRVLAAGSATLSLSHYPAVGATAACAVAALVGLAVAWSPTKLRRKALCAAAIFAVPVYPETLAIPLHTNWLLAILLFLVVLWDESDERSGWRVGYLAVAGLSSPVIVLVAPFLWLRAYLYRRSRAQIALAVFGSLIAALQLVHILVFAEGLVPSRRAIVFATLPTFLGRFVLGAWTENPTWLWAGALAVAGILALALRQARREHAFVMLVGLLAGMIVLLLARIDPGVLHPRHYGGRYFFFPFVLLWWILIQAWDLVHSARLRAAVAATAVLGLANALAVWWPRPQADLDLRWTAHALTCSHFDRYSLPIYTGLLEPRPGVPFVMPVTLSGADCARLLARDLLLSHAGSRQAPTYPYTVLYGRHWPRDERQRAEIVSATMAGSDPERSVIPGLRVIGSSGAASPVGEVIVRLHRGDHLAYRRGSAGRGQTITIVGRETEFIVDAPAVETWARLDFSNDRLPDEFLVVIGDNGIGPDEWSAIAVKE